MGKQRVEVERLNFDVECFLDIVNNTGFFITDPPEINIDDEKKRSLNGPQSPLYGTSITDERGYGERYRCECGEFRGILFKDEECPKCHTKVEFRDINPRMTGWISLGQHKVISPHYFKILQNAFGETELNEIAYTKKRVDRDGKRHSLNYDESKVYDPKTPFYGIGTDEFRMRFDEIMSYFEKKKPNKSDTFKLIRKERLKVFTSHIPVYTTALRQQASTVEDFYFTGIDKIYNTLVSHSRLLKNANEIEIPAILGSIQNKLSKAWDYNFNLIDGKDGLIRDQLTGGSLNFTSRSVIIPDPSLREYEVDLSYSCIYIMYKFKIIYYLMKIYDISLAKANAVWENGFNFDPKIYKIMKLMIEKEKPMVMINRNPTLNFYSLIRMCIRNIFPDSDTYVMSLPFAILPGTNADQPNQGPLSIVIWIIELCELLTRGVYHFR